MSKLFPFVAWITDQMAGIYWAFWTPQASFELCDLILVEPFSGGKGCFPACGSGSPPIGVMAWLNCIMSDPMAVASILDTRWGSPLPVGCLWAQPLEPQTSRGGVQRLCRDGFRPMGWNHPRHRWWPGWCWETPCLFLLAFAWPTTTSQKPKIDLWILHFCPVECTASSPT